MGEREQRLSPVAWLIVPSRVTLAAALLLLTFPTGLWAGPTAADEVVMQVRSVTIDRTSNSPVVVLQSEEQGKALPIWIGHFEAQAIAMEMEGVSGPRPLTHDLMKKIVEELDAEVERVVIDDLRNQTYYASIHLLSHGNHLRIDSRPSDAIALALRFRKPILVNATLLLGEAAVELGTEGQGKGRVGRLWGLTLQDVTAELAGFFELGEGQGILVSDVTRDAVAGEIRRGDIITSVNGQAVRTLVELEARAKQIENGKPVELGVRRKGAEVRVSFESGGA
jgi:bifunctional DNase/RNase